MSALRILIADDHPIVRAGVRALFDASPDIDVVGEAATGEEALALSRHLAPDVVLCDLRMGDGMDGIAATRALRALAPAPAVIILTTFDRDIELLGAIEAGASGYVLKDSPPDAIVRAVRDAAAGRLALTAELSERVVQVLRAPRVRLTEREQDVLRLLDEGASNQHIAKTLFVSEATVKTHLVHIFAKLGVDTRSRAVAVARERGLL